MARHQPSSRFTLSVELALVTDLGLVWTQATFPGALPLPLGGGEVAQLSIIAIPLLLAVEVSHCLRRCWRAVATWWQADR